MKKIILSIFVSFLLSSTAFAVELPETANLPPVFAKNVDGNIVYKESATAFTGNDYNSIFSAYNLRLKLGTFCSLPLNFAENVDGNVVYGNRSMGYSPLEFNSALQAYDLSLSAEDVITYDLAQLNYAHVEDGQVILHKTVILYTPSELSRVLAAYKLPPELAMDPMDMDQDDDGVIDARDLCPDTVAGLKVNDRGCWMIEEKVLFAFDSAKINPSYMPTLFDTGLLIMKNPMLNIQIDGHADSTGSDAYNQKLSEKRAMAVKSYLVDKAYVDENRLSIKGYGESQPAVPNNSKENRAKNRRVEFTTK